jgi:hypothetical protein
VKWWTDDGVPLPDILAIRPGLARWWGVLRAANLCEIAFHYELAARLAPNPEQHPYRYVALRTTEPQYPYGVPFSDLSDHGFGALMEGCRELLDFPRRGYEASEPAIYVLGDPTHITVGKDGWTNFVDSPSRDSKRFAVNLRRSNARILAAMRAREEILNIAAVTDVSIKNLLSELRIKYGVSSPDPKRVYGERRNYKPWKLVEALDEASLYTKYRGVSWHAARLQGVGKYAENEVPGDLRKRLVDAQECYCSFLDLFDETYGDRGWETRWEYMLQDTDIRAAELLAKQANFR